MRDGIGVALPKTTIVFPSAPARAHGTTSSRRAWTGRDLGRWGRSGATRCAERRPRRGRVFPASGRAARVQPGAGRAVAGMGPVSQGGSGGETKGRDRGSFPSPPGGLRPGGRGGRRGRRCSRLAACRTAASRRRRGQPSEAPQDPSQRSTPPARRSRPTEASRRAGRRGGREVVAVRGDLTGQAALEAPEVVGAVGQPLVDVVLPGPPGLGGRVRGDGQVSSR